MPNYKPIIPPELQSEKEKKLLAERERIDTKLTYHKHRLKALEHEEAQLARKARNHRIFTRGGMLESFLIKPTLLTDDQVHIARVSGHRCAAQRPDCAPSGHPIIEAFC